MQLIIIQPKNKHMTIQKHNHLKHTHTHMGSLTHYQQIKYAVLK